MSFGYWSVAVCAATEGDVMRHPNGRVVGPTCGWGASMEFVDQWSGVSMEFPTCGRTPKRTPTIKKSSGVSTMNALGGAAICARAGADGINIVLIDTLYPTSSILDLSCPRGGTERENEVMLVSKKRKKAPQRARTRKQRRDLSRWTPTLLALIRFVLWLYYRHCE